MFREQELDVFVQQKIKYSDIRALRGRQTWFKLGICVCGAAYGCPLAPEVCGTCQNLCAASALCAHPLEWGRSMHGYPAGSVRGDHRGQGGEKTLMQIEIKLTPLDVY